MNGKLVIQSIVPEEEFETQTQFNTSQVTPTADQNGYEKKFFDIPGAPQKQQRPPIIKSKVPQPDRTNFQTEEGCFVLATSSKVTGGQSTADVVPDIGVKNPSSIPKPRLIPTSKNIQRSSRNEFPRRTQNCTRFPKQNGAAIKVTTASKVGRTKIQNTAPTPPVVHPFVTYRSRSRSNEKKSTKVQVPATFKASPKPKNNMLAAKESSSATSHSASSNPNGDACSNVDIEVQEACSNPDIAIEQNAVIEGCTNGVTQNTEAEPNLVAPTLHVEDDKPKRKPVYYKSKFWKYLDTDRSKDTVPSKPEKGKAYDQDKVRDYMEKQKELRRLREKQEEEVKRREREKKKLQLQELDEKRKDLIKPSSVKKDSTTPVANIQTEHVRALPQQARVKSNLTPMKVTPDAAVRTSLLLQEFENIVHKECLSVFKTHSEKLSGAYAPKADKAVETTASLLEGRGGSDDSTASSFAHSINSPFETIGMRNVVSSATAVSSYRLRNQAATKIQSAFKGYRIRKILKEANFLPASSSRPRRRRSFYSAEKKKPVEPTASRRPENGRVEYIPRPSPFSPSSPASNGNLKNPITLSMPYKTNSNLKSFRFEEPFPKEAIKKIQERNSPIQGTSAEKRLSMGSNLTLRSAEENALNGSARRLSLNMNYATPLSKPFDIDTVDIPNPSFSAVLREKIRILQEKTMRPTAGSNQIKPSMPLAAASRPDADKSHFQLPYFDSDNSTVTDDYIGPDLSEMQRAYVLRKSTRSEFDPSIPRPPAEKKSKTRSRPSYDGKVQQTTTGEFHIGSSVSDSKSSTTVETDLEIKHREYKTRERTAKPNDSTPTSKTDSSYSSSQNYPVPILELAYKAEKERLSVIDQALQTTLALEAAKARREADEANAAGNRGKVQEAQTPTNNISNAELFLNIAKCQAEQMKAQVEVTQWISELRLTAEKEGIKNIQGIDMTAIVNAVVEGAKKFTQESIQSHQLQTERKTLIRDQVNQFPSDSSRSESLQNEYKLKAAGKGTHIFESQVRRLQEEQKQRTISSTTSVTDEQDNRINNAIQVESQNRMVSSSAADSAHESSDEQPAGTSLSAEQSEHEHVKEDNFAEEINSNISAEHSFVHTIEDEIYPSVFDSEPMSSSKQQSGPLSAASDLVESDLQAMKHEEGKTEMQSETKLTIERTISSTTSVTDEQDNRINNAIQVESQKRMVSSSAADSAHESDAIVSDEQPAGTSLSVEQSEHEHVKEDNFAEEINSNISAEHSFVHTIEDENYQSVSDSEPMSSSKQQSGPLSAASDLVESDPQAMKHEEGKTEMQSETKLTPPAERDVDESPKFQQSVEPIVSDSVDTTSPPLDEEKDFVYDARITQKLSNILETDYSLNNTAGTSLSVEQSEHEHVKEDNFAEDINSNISAEHSFAHTIEDENYPSVFDSELMSSSKQQSGLLPAASDLVESDPQAMKHEEGKTEMQSEPKVTPPAEQDVDESPKFQQSVEPIVSDSADTTFPPQDGEKDFVCDARITQKLSNIGTSLLVEHVKEDNFAEEINSNISAEHSFAHTIEDENYPSDFDSEPMSSSKQQSGQLSAASDLVESDPQAMKHEEGKTEMQSEPKVTPPAEQDVDESPKFQQSVEPIVSDSADTTFPPQDEEKDFVCDARITQKLSNILENDRSLNNTAGAIIRKLVQEVVKKERISAKIAQPNNAQSVRDRIKEIMSGIRKSSSDIGKPNAFPFILSTEDYGESVEEKIADPDDEWFEDDLISGTSPPDADDETLKKEAEKILKEQRRIEDEIRALELEALSAQEIPSKPPPPYSPPSSSSSLFSLYGRFFASSFDETKLMQIVDDKVDSAWQAWSQVGCAGIEQWVLEMNKKDATATPMENTTENLPLIAINSFETLVADTITKIITEVLQAESEIDKPYIDKIRPGRLALTAQRLRLPRSKEALAKAVFQKFLEIIPVELAGECLSPSSSLAVSTRRKLSKWTNRPRDKVDEVLVEELIEEDREWTEYWPEEILVMRRTQDDMLKKAVSEVVRAFRIVFG